MLRIGKTRLAALAAALSLAGAAHARSFEDITASRYLSICAAPQELPFSAQDGPARGLYIDIAERIAQALALELRVEWIRSREQVRFTACDAVMGTALLKDAAAPEPDPAKLHRQLRTIPYLTAGAVIVAAPKIGAIASLRDLRPHHVAVPSASLAHKVLNDNAVPVWVRFRTDREIIEAVERGDAEAGVVTSLAIGWHQKQHGADGLNVFPRVLDQAELGFQVGIGLRNTNLATLERVNAALAGLIADGSIDAILARYGAQGAAR